MTMGLSLSWVGFDRMMKIQSLKKLDLFQWQSLIMIQSRLIVVYWYTGCNISESEYWI